VELVRLYKGEHIVTANKNSDHSQTTDDAAARQRALIGLCAADAQRAQEKRKLKLRLPAPLN
jgi:hypothetical protein